jgi:hypothetical protein
MVGQRDAVEPRGVVGVDGDDRDVVAAVDLREVAQVGLGEARLGRQQAPAARLRRQRRKP